MSSSATKAGSAPPVRTEDPWKDPVAYLLSRGWRPADSSPHAPGCRWLDPTRGERDTETKVKVGTKKGPNGREADVFQVLITPRAFPCVLAEAVQTQLARELAREQAKE